MKITLLILSGSLLALTACSNYEVSLNDRQIYTPAPIITHVKARDLALRDCLLQTLEDQQIRNVKQLTALGCSSAGISDLNGIEQFPNLTELHLPENDIRSIEPLHKLPRLETLNISKNPVQSIKPLLGLLKLSSVILEDVSADCKDITELKSLVMDVKANQCS